MKNSHKIKNENYSMDQNSRYRDSRMFYNTYSITTFKNASSSIWANLNTLQSEINCEKSVAT